MKNFTHTLVAFISLILTAQAVLGQLAAGVDLNADGKAELLVASGSSGTVTVLDGATHATIRTIAAPVANSGFGAAVSWLTDVNGDGYGDLAVLAPWTTNSASWGKVYVYSLATGALLSSTDAPATRHFAGILKLVADQDGDSIADVLVEMQSSTAPSKSVLISTRTGAILAELPGTVAEMLNYVAQGGKLYARSDIDGSGAVDLMDVAAFTQLVKNGDLGADLNHDGVIDKDDTLVMLTESQQGIVTIAGQVFVSSGSQGGGGGSENCRCADSPASNTSPCAGVSVSVSFPSNIRVGEPFQLTITGVPSGGSICSEIVQGNGLILNASASPISLVVFDNNSVCVRVKYTVTVGNEECSKCETVCLAATVECPSYAISLHCPTLGDDCPVMVSANSLNTVFALVTPEGAAVYWEIEDLANLVEWHLEYPTQLKFRTKNAAGTFKVKARYGPASGPCPAAYAECVITVDPDSDGDGLSDSWENAHCTLPGNHDTDGDGVWDGAEIAMGTDPCNPNSTPAMIDSDGDGLTDIEEYQVYHTDPHLFDTDGDGVQDYAEVELNRLGVLAMDPLRAYSLAEGNTNLPHVFDGWQASYYLAWDKDRDGLFDPWELATGLDPTQVDQDGDGIGDGLEMRPRVLPQSAWGSPPTVPARTAVYAEDGVRGGGSSIDSDRDGLTDVQEDWIGTNPQLVDSDGDGVLDRDETEAGLNPVLVSSSGAATGNDGTDDFDGDGVTNLQESRHGSNLAQQDTDGDGSSDGQEATQGSNSTDASDNGLPLDPAEYAEIEITAFTFAIRDQFPVMHLVPGALIARIGPYQVRVFGSRTPVGYGYDNAYVQEKLYLRRGQIHPLIYLCTPRVWSSPCTSGGMAFGEQEGGGLYFKNLSTCAVLAPPEAKTIPVAGESVFIGLDGVTFENPGGLPYTYHGRACNGSVFTRQGDPVAGAMDIYIPVIEGMYDLRDWSPVAARLGVVDPLLQDIDPNDDYRHRFIRLEHTTPDIPSGAQHIGGAITDGVSAMVLKLAPLPKIVSNGYLSALLQRIYPSANTLPRHTELGGFLMEFPYGHAFDPLSGAIYHSSIDPITDPSSDLILYIPPDHFGDSDANTDPWQQWGTGETCEATFWAIGSGYSAMGGYELGTATFRRPPVVLVHGFWGSNESWKSNVWDEAHVRTTLYKVDYSANSLRGPFENITALPSKIDRALYDLRDGFIDGKKYAATQVDMVGHSMGGQVIRWYLSEIPVNTDLPWTATQSPNARFLARGNSWPELRVAIRSDDPASPQRANRRADNYFAGDVHRYIALGSPFRGSPLADAFEPVLKPTRANIDLITDLVNDPPGISGLLWNQLGPLLFPRLGGSYRAPTAAFDLKEPSSNNLVNRLYDKSHYYVGSYLSQELSPPWTAAVGSCFLASDVENLFSGYATYKLRVDIFRDFAPGIIGLPALNLHTAFGRLKPEDSDIIVLTGSQVNTQDLGQAMIRFTQLQHCELPIMDLPLLSLGHETQSSVVRDAIRETLNGPIEHYIRGGLK